MRTDPPILVVVREVTVRVMGNRRKGQGQFGLVKKMIPRHVPRV